MCRHEWLFEVLSKKYELKRELVGPHEGRKRSVSFLGRSSSWTQTGYEYEADRKHVTILLEEWGLQNCRGVQCPASKEDNIMGTSRNLEGAEATRYRRAAARLHYLGQDRPDISQAAKEISRSMANPRRK